MIVFVYGTLLDPATLAQRSGGRRHITRLMSAVLPGWRRVTLTRTRWPTLRRDGRANVTGLLVRADACAMAHLSAYEGPLYRLVRVVPRGRHRPIAAWTWIAQGGTYRPWRG